MARNFIFWPGIFFFGQEFYFWARSFFFFFFFFAKVGHFWSAVVFLVQFPLLFSSASRSLPARFPFCGKINVSQAFCGIKAAEKHNQLQKARRSKFWLFGFGGPNMK